MIGALKRGRAGKARQNVEHFGASALKQGDAGKKVRRVSDLNRTIELPRLDKIDHAHALLPLRMMRGVECPCIASSIAFEVAKRGAIPALMRSSWEREMPLIAESSPMTIPAVLIGTSRQRRVVQLIMP